MNTKPVLFVAEHIENHLYFNRNIQSEHFFYFLLELMNLFEPLDRYLYLKQKQLRNHLFAGLSSYFSLESHFHG